MRESRSSIWSWILWGAILFLTCNRCKLDERVSHLEAEARRTEARDAAQPMVDGGSDAGW